MSDSRLIDTDLVTPEAKERMQEIYIPRVPMQRMGEPSEVANVVAFLCSSRASFITGANIIVDGGFSSR
jgi:NAD(P)-dependent dehydrogenase (short-subunit alcohol dehydrogenase family)